MAARLDPAAPGLEETVHVHPDGRPETELTLPPTAHQCARRPDPLDCRIEAVDQRTPELGIAARHHAAKRLEVRGGPKDPGREGRRAAGGGALLDDGDLGAALSSSGGRGHPSHAAAKDEEVWPHD